MFNKILIANRGEVALRILRACRELGISSVAVHSTADSSAMHVRLADESVCIGPPKIGDSYLNAAAIISAAEITRADAIHPGYGFLSENADFAQMVADHGFTFIGPSVEHLRTMGDKIVAKATAKSLGLPVVPGTADPISNERDALIQARQIGTPLLIKAVSGGGGRGMTVVRESSKLSEALSMARNEARVGFGDDRVYLERYLEKPRHIEIQILGDTHGQVVHLGERDCSMQRRHQKLIEEAPSPVLSEQERHEIGDLSVKAMKKLGYVGLGTIEYLYSGGAFYFIEMNTRLQVEHPVTEMITGLDLVQEQIKVAAGHKLAITQADVEFRGHAIECRINAEDPETMTPTPGPINTYHPPGGPGVRMDSAIYAGYTVPPYYDSLIGKLIVHGPDRPSAIQRMDRCLGECVVDGVPSSIPLLRELMAHPNWNDSEIDTDWLTRYLQARS